MKRTLTIRVAGRYFDQIKAGEKVCEYRLAKEYWSRLLVGRVYDQVVLLRGYPKSGGIEGRTRLTLPWQGYTLRRIVHDHFGPEPVRVFAIRVDRRAAA